MKIVYNRYADADQRVKYLTYFRVRRIGTHKILRSTQHRFVFQQKRGG
jgi:hypothetical protein